jgi:hypothetical protein
VDKRGFRRACETGGESTIRAREELKTNVKLSELRSNEDIAAEELRNPEVRREYERTAFANAVAIRVIRHRSKHTPSPRDPRFPPDSPVEHA